MVCVVYVSLFFKTERVKKLKKQNTSGNNKAAAFDNQKSDPPGKLFVPSKTYDILLKEGRIRQSKK
jgi:hypothetical protein